MGAGCPVECHLLLPQQFLDRMSNRLTNNGEAGQQVDQLLHVVLAERDYHKQHLHVHLDDGLSYQCGSEEGPEGNKEVTARDA